MLFSILRGDYTPMEILVSVFALAFVIFCTMPVHEYAHALVASKLGRQYAASVGQTHLESYGAYRLDRRAYDNTCRFRLCKARSDKSEKL